MKLSVVNIDGYLATQLCCCYKWRGNTFHGWDEEKLARFHNTLTEYAIAALKGKIMQLQNEIDYNWRLSLKEYLPEYCALIPEAYRQKAYDNCKGIIADSNEVKDIQILSRIETLLNLDLVSGAHEI